MSYTLYALDCTEVDLWLFTVASSVKASMDWGTSVRCGGSSSHWPRFAKLPESCWLLMRRILSVCLKVCKTSWAANLVSVLADDLTINSQTFLWCQEFLVNEACIVTLSYALCAAMLGIVNGSSVVFQVMLCSGVWWGSVCWTRVRWSLITSWVWRLKISWRGGCRHRSSNSDLPRASTMPVSLSARGTFGKLWGSWETHLK